MMSDSEAIELQNSQRIHHAPNTEKGSVLDPLVESQSGHDVSGRSSDCPLEPSYSKTPENKSRSRKKGYRQTLSLISHLALVHVPPVAITLTILGLYIGNVRWINPTNNALNALQFAAKIHEGLIIVSVGDILMGRINHHLLNRGDSLPLGFLPSPLLLNSPFLYLISSELWAPILSFRGQHRTRKATGAMILLSAILCIAASPLSAITMIPRQGWRLVELGIQYSERLTYTPGTLYNNDLDAGAIPDINYTRHSSWWARPSQRSILETTINNKYSSGPFTNVTYSNYEATARPMSYKTSRLRMIATCPLSTVARHLGDSNFVLRTPNAKGKTKAENKEDGSSTPRKWKQPLVSTQCSRAALKDDIASFYFQYPIFNESAEVFQYLDIHSAQYPWLLEVSKNMSNSSSPRGYAFLNIKDSKQLPISTDIMFATLINETWDTQAETAFAPIVPVRPAYILFTLCLISARWAEADVWVEPDRSEDALSHFNFATEDAETAITGSFGTPDFINIHQNWMTGIGSVPTTSANRSSYTEAQDFCMTARPRTLDSECVESFLAMHVTDAIAEVGGFREEERDSSGIWIQPVSKSVVYTSYEYLYSYEFKNSIGIPIAFSVLLLHVLVVFVYIPLVFWSEHLRHKSGWSSLGDLLVLTLCSDVDVDWTKGKASQKWIKPVVVRELGDEGRKGMIVRDIANNVD